MLITWTFRAPGQIPEPLWRSVADNLPAVGERVVTKSVDGNSTTLEIKEVYRLVQFTVSNADLGMSQFEGVHFHPLYSERTVETKGTVILEKVDYPLF